MLVSVTPSNTVALASSKVNADWLKHTVSNQTYTSQAYLVNVHWMKITKL